VNFVQLVMYITSLYVGVCDMEMKTEADSNDITEFSLDYKPSIGKPCLFLCNRFSLCYGVIFRPLTVFLTNNAKCLHFVY